MEDLKKLFLFLAVLSLFSSGIVSTVPVFADDDDDEGDDNKGKKTKTLESECAKKKPTNFDGLFCLAIFSLQSAIADLQIQIDNLELTSVPEGPPGTDGTDGINCWDLNENGSADFPDEDVNGDSSINVADCRGEQGPEGPAGQGGNPFTDVQQKIDDKNSEISQIQSNITLVESQIANLNSQLVDLELTPSQKQACLSLCALNPGQPCSCTYHDPAAANVIIQQIVNLQTQLDTLNQQLEDCQFELMVLQTLQNQFVDSGGSTPFCDDSSQIAGDCQTLQCNANDELISVPDDADIPSSNNECVIPQCSAGNPDFPPAPFGTLCEQGFGECDGFGQCIVTHPWDVVFLFDITGSMASEINAFQSSFPNLLTTIDTSSGGDYRIGIVTFGDGVTVLTPLTSDIPTINGAVASLTIGEGQSGEASNEAKNTVINNLLGGQRADVLGNIGTQTGDFDVPWNSNAIRIAILMTDAGPSGFDNIVDVADITQMELLGADAGALGIKFSDINTGNDPSVTNALFQDAFLSGGLLRLAPDVQVATAIQDILLEEGGPGTGQCFVDSDCSSGFICLSGGTSGSPNFCAPEGTLPPP